MLEDTVAELVEIYLRRANVSQEIIEKVMADRKPVEYAVRWLRQFAAADEETLEDNPLEW